MNLLLDTVGSLWQVVLVGILFGAGLPTVFALGMRSLAAGTSENPDVAAHPLGKVGAVLCFAVVVVAIVAGILLLTSDFLASTFGISVF